MRTDRPVDGTRSYLPSLLKPRYTALLSSETFAAQPTGGEYETSKALFAGWVSGFARRRERTARPTDLPQQWPGGAGSGRWPCPQVPGSGPGGGTLVDAIPGQPAERVRRAG